MQLDQVNQYLIPSVIHAFMLGLIGLYAVANFRKSPRLFITGVMALALSAVFGVYANALLLDRNYSWKPPGSISLCRYPCFCLCS